MLKKIILSFLVVSIIFASFAPTVQAAWYDQSFLEFSSKVYDDSNDEIFGERYTFAQVNWIFMSVLLSLIGTDISSIFSQLQEIQEGREIQEDETSIAPLYDAISSAGLPKMAGGMMDIFYKNPPASGIGWVNDIKERVDFIPEAQAQGPGFGYRSLEVFLPIWRAIRNLSYLILVVVILAVSFMIMFRVKINPQTAVTAQSSIPRIAMVIVLITFSYAIAGFVIDLMYVLFGVIVFGISIMGGLSTASGSVGPGELFTNFVSGTTGDLFGFIAKTGFTGVLNILGSTGPGQGLLAIFAVIIVLGIILSVGTFGLGLLAFIGPVLGLVVAALVFLLKTVLSLAQTYLSLLINVVFAPIIILADVIPGVKNATMGWFKSIVADVGIFFVTGFLILMYGIFSQAIDLFVDGGGSVWGPPYIGSNPTLLKGMLALGIVVILPNVRSTVYKFMQKTDFGSPDLSGIGREVSGLSRAVDPKTLQELPKSGNWAGKILSKLGPKA